MSMNLLSRSGGALRAVKSLPSLRCAAEQSISANVAPKVPHIPSRYLHKSTPSTKPSHVLNSSSSFAAQTVATLRAECKKRGIKTNGRKAELIDRLASFEAAHSTVSSVSMTSSRKMTTSKPLKAAVASSPSPDAFRIPRETQEQREEERQKSMSIKIPVLPHIPKKAQTVETHYDTVPPTGGQAAASHNHSGTEESIPVRSMGYHKVSSFEDAYRVVQGEASARDKPYQSTEGVEDAQLEDKDKWFLAGFAAVVAGWWWLGSSSQKKKKKSH